MDMSGEQSKGISMYYLLEIYPGHLLLTHSVMQRIFNYPKQLVCGFLHLSGKKVIPVTLCSSEAFLLIKGNQSYFIREINSKLTQLFLQTGVPRYFVKRSWVSFLRQCVMKTMGFETDWDCRNPSLTTYQLFDLR